MELINFQTCSDLSHFAKREKKHSDNPDYFEQNDFFFMSMTPFYNKIVVKITKIKIMIK